MDTAPSAFTLGDYEEIVGRMIIANETRKREYTRWTAAGITSILVLLSLLIERLRQAPLGAYPFLTVFLMFGFAYVLTRLAWELLEGNILQAVRIILASEEPKPRPWDTFRALYDLAEIKLTPRRMVFSPIGLSLAFTLGLFAASYALWAQSFASLLLITALWRFGVFVLYVPIFRWFRQLGRKLVPDKERIRVQVGAVEYSPEALRGGRILSSAVMGLIVAYYAVQLLLLWNLIESAVPLVYDIGQVFLLALGISGLLNWIRAITWPLVETYSAILRRLQGLHSKILSGELTNASEVQLEIKQLISLTSYS